MAKRTQPKDGALQAWVTPHAPLPSSAGSSGSDGGGPPVPVLFLEAQPCALTHREKECLRLAARGMGRWEIGALLGISHSTTTFHLLNAAKKLGVPDVQTAIERTSPDDVS